MDVMRNEPLDFIGVDYAVDNRDVEETVLPVGAVLPRIRREPPRRHRRDTGHEPGASQGGVRRSAVTRCLSRRVAEGAEPPLQRRSHAGLSILTR